MELRHCHCQAQPTQPAPSLITMSCKQSLLALVSMMTQTEIETHVTDKRCTTYMYTLYIYTSLYTILQMDIDANWSRQISTWKTPDESNASEMFYAFLAAVVYHKYNICYRYLSQCSDLVTCILTLLQISKKNITQLLVAIRHLSLPQKWQSTQFSPQFLQNFTNGNSSSHGLNFSHFKP